MERKLPVNAQPRILLFQDDSPPARGLNVALRQRGLATQSFELAATNNSWLGPADAAIVVLGSSTAEAQARAEDALRALKQKNIATLLWSPAGANSAAGRAFEYLPATTSIDEVVGRLAMLARYGPQLRQMEREVEQLQRVGAQLRKYFDEVERDMSLAGRLQRSFLPAAPLRLPRMDVNHVYRPATWVSGDIFDVFRVDESTIGIFIADVMGHGTAAGLITMFLRRALTAKHIGRDSHRVLAPVEVLTNVHQALVHQGLPGSQFVTAVYATIDVTTLTLRMARGGHPYPLRLPRAGGVVELRAQGGLMGVADLDPEFIEAQTTLAVGDRLVFFTDGIEDVLIERAEGSETPRLTPVLQRWSQCGPDELIQNLVRDLDAREGSVHPPDDITLLALEITE